MPPFLVVEAGSCYGRRTAGYGSDGVGRQEAATKVLDAVNSYRSFVNTNAVLKVLDQHKNTTLVSSLHDALNKLENEMQRHAA